MFPNVHVRAARFFTDTKSNFLVELLGFVTSLRDLLRSLKPVSHTFISIFIRMCLRVEFCFKTEGSHGIFVPISSFVLRGFLWLNHIIDNTRSLCQYDVTMVFHSINSFNFCKTITVMKIISTDLFGRGET